VVATAREISRLVRSGNLRYSVAAEASVIAEFFAAIPRTIAGTWLPVEERRRKINISGQDNNKSQTGKRPMASTKLQNPRKRYRAELDDAERASRDAMLACNQRLAWSLAHAYTCLHTKSGLDHSGAQILPTSRIWSTSPNCSVHVKTDLRDN